MKLKIKDIAKKAGVSTTAVSFALNGKAGISDETRKKILDIVKEEGYTTNALMKTGGMESDGSLMESKLIMLLCPVSNLGEEDSWNVSLSFYEIMKEIEKSINEYHHYLFFKSVQIQAGFQEKLKEIIETYRIRGIIVLATDLTSQEMKAICDVPVPVVAIDRYFRDISVDCISFDNFAGACEAVRYLIGLGHTKIGYICSTVDSENFKERQAGYEATLRENGIEPEKAYMIRVDNNGQEIEPYLMEALGRLSKLPTAFFTESDTLAVETIKCLQQLKIDVPGEVSVVGFDNIVVANLVTPELTTMSVPWTDLADLAVGRLIDKMEEEQGRNLKMKIEVKLIERNSCQKK
ncbi:LacI family DNA-binding transcriptional regulator [Diplocloster modestus]|uniref:LacI family DNA-binding transcriptional regulator n=1 Tax=Diplocloster modestus TaxID=2850322 RepID=A0ABS6KCM2_9FIRM|nr:LacI family DNA-binding transcriptional regulator [Diplocloster modestus]MBU9728260.1 LacI family DNA-binding transcriptional regulator [Diplocloster modestus]